MQRSPGGRPSLEQFLKDDTGEVKKAPFIDVRPDGPFLVDPARGKQMPLPTEIDDFVVHWSKSLKEWMLKTSSGSVPPRKIEALITQGDSVSKWPLGHE